MIAISHGLLIRVDLGGHGVLILPILTLAELLSFNPHSFRNTLVVLVEQLCENIEGFKAWSQNLGHEVDLVHSLLFNPTDKVLRVEHPNEGRYT